MKGGHGGRRAGSGRKRLGKVTLTCYVQPSTLAWIKRLQRYGEPLGAVIDRLVAQALDRPP
jgi:hypothetical protein